MKKVFLGILTLCMLLLCGCWDVREINELGFVMAVGIDKDSSQNGYIVTVQVANPSSGGSESNKGGAPTGGVWIGTQEGESIFDAVRKLSRMSSKRIMWAHNNVIIIGESLAREGITPIVDFFTHNPELRMKTPVVIAKGDAKGFLTAKAGMEIPPGLSFTKFAIYRALVAQSVQSDMLQVSENLISNHEQPIITGVSLKKAVTVSDNSSSNQQSESETVVLSGTAVFREDKMVGWLSPEESRGLAWILNETKSTVVTVIDPLHNNKAVSVETRGVRAKISTHVIKGIPHVKVNISGDGSIVEEDGPTKQDINEMKEHVKGLLNRRITDEINTSLKKVQKEYNVDVLDFAKYVHAQNKTEWNEGLKRNWNRIFPDIPVKVRVNIHITDSTLNQKSINFYRTETEEN